MKRLIICLLVLCFFVFSESVQAKDFLVVTNITPHVVKRIIEETEQKGTSGVGAGTGGGFGFWGGMRYCGLPCGIGGGILGGMGGNKIEKDIRGQKSTKETIIEETTLYCLDFSDYPSLCTYSDKYKVGDRIGPAEIKNMQRKN